MQQREREIVVLKPTPTFLSFLRAYDPELKLPSLSSLKKNMTAYSMPRHASDDILLDEIERNYILMFRHEIQRVSKTVDLDKLQVSFLDFLCCFKFELHAQVIVMEASIEEGQQVVCVKPRSVLLHWIRSYAEEDQDVSDVLERVSLKHLTDNATMIVKNFKSAEAVSQFLKQYHRPIYKAEMYRMCDDKSSWPVVKGFEDFNRYFEVDVHQELIHLN